MTVDTALLLARYNQHANREMNKVLETLTSEEWESDRGGYFGSFRSLTGHIYTADVHWLVRFSGRRRFQVVKGSVFDFPPSWSEPPFALLADYLRLREDMDQSLLGFTAELRDDDLAADLDFRNSRGEAKTMNFGALVLHVFNHQTHHRGQISLLLDQMKKPNDYSNIMAIL